MDCNDKPINPYHMTPKTPTEQAREMYLSVYNQIRKEIKIYAEAQSKSAIEICIKQCEQIIDILGLENMCMACSDDENNITNPDYWQQVITELSKGK
jgi:hypothetical protein